MGGATGGRGIVGFGGAGQWAPAAITLAIQIYNLDYGTFKDLMPYV